jgi:hypothetical protein
VLKTGLENAMADPTAVARVSRYRKRQRKLRDIERVEVQVPSAASEDVKRWSQKLRDTFRHARDADAQIDFVLGTINAPRPASIDARTLIHCLVAPVPDRRWQAHIEALFDEVSEEAVHDLVLAGIVSFEDLYRASRTWKVMHGRIIGWIKEMADLGLANAAAQRDQADRHA